MDDVRLEFEAAGRKGEEAIDIDLASMLVGDWCTIRLGETPADGELRLMRSSDDEWRLIGTPGWRDVEAGDRYLEGSLAYDQRGQMPGFLRIERRRRSATR